VLFKETVQVHADVTQLSVFLAKAFAKFNKLLVNSESKLPAER